MYSLALVLYHFIFFRRLYQNPYLLSTAEIASTFFPHWIWMGRKWQATDNIYYKYPACIPFLSMFYPPSIILSKITKYLSLDIDMKIYIYFILSHFLLGSLLAYHLTHSLFFAITVAYSGYMIKPHTPPAVYTMMWIPGCFIGGWLGVLSLCMAVLGGYWPVLVYVLPVLAIVNPLCLLGLIPALPQIIPFLWYWPKSVRAVEKLDRNIGKVPWWKFKDLIWPSDSVMPTNGVNYWEMHMYMGIAPFLIWNWSWWWILLALTVLIAIGIIPQIQRIPARVLYLLTFLISYFSILNSGLQNLALLSLLNAFLLLRNSEVLASFPLTQWWNKPSKLYSKPITDSWPFFSGYLFNKKLRDYRGAFALR